MAPMALVFEEVHAASDAKKVNEEWYVLANASASQVSTAGLRVLVTKPGKKGEIAGQIDPGFVLQAGEKILLVSGFPGKKAQGEPPTREGMRVYFLLQKEGLLRGGGTIIRLVLNQMELAKVTYDPKAPNGVAAG